MLLLKSRDTLNKYHYTVYRVFHGGCLPISWMLVKRFFCLLGEFSQSRVFLSPHSHFTCNHSRDYSIRTAESHMNFNGVQDVRLKCSNTEITWMVAVCNVQMGLQNSETTVHIILIHISTITITFIPPSVPEDRDSMVLLHFSCFLIQCYLTARYKLPLANIQSVSQVVVMG